MPSIKEPINESLKRQRRDFPALVKEMLATRSGYRCSNPTCRTSTSGPREDTRWNMGIVAQVRTAIAGGPRYDDTLTPGQQGAITNGVWLCQRCSQLIDSDPSLFPSSTLKHWRDISEDRALGSPCRPAMDMEYSILPDVERLMPELLIELREDLAERPQCRVIALCSKEKAGSGLGRNVFIFSTESYTNLETKIAILQNYFLVHSIGRGKPARFRISEELAYYCQLGSKYR